MARWSEPQVPGPGCVSDSSVGARETLGQEEKAEFACEHVALRDPSQGR